MTTTAHAAMEVLRRHGERVEAHLRDVLAAQGGAPARLMESVAYSLEAGGKRLRPGLVLEFAQVCGGIGDSALAAAAAVELVHTFSLVHDDLPAMDDDDLRRGRPTNHKVFGEAMAILAGDAMTAIAFHVLGTRAEQAKVAPLVLELAAATGPDGMIGGQVLDMEGEGKRLGIEELTRLHRMKTGALLRASCRMGVIAAGGSAEQLQAATRYGEHLGLAFQIVDDLLDLTATPEEMGKATRKDSAKGKNTYPSLLGVDGAREQARREVEDAVASVQVFGNAGVGLKNLAQFVIHRTH